jgi:hypothetical protein
MTLRLRRGTDLERQSITFQEGELVYITDTNDLYAGDGTTVGGIKVSNVGTPSSLTQGLNLNGYNIQGSGTISATSFFGDGSGLTGIDTGGIQEGQEYNIDIRGNVKAVDSTLLVDANAGAFFGTFVGDGSLISNIAINQLDEVEIFSPQDGDVLAYSNGLWINSSTGGIIQGADYAINIISDDSSVMVNSSINEITAATGSFDGIRLNSNFLKFSADDTLNTQSQELQVSSNDSRSVISFLRKSEGVIDNLPLGAILFEKDDTNGTSSNGIIIGRTNSIIISSDDTGVFDLDTFVTVYNGGLLGVGTAVPEAKLDVHGNSVLRGSLTVDGLITGDLKGSIFIDDSTRILDGTSGELYAANIDIVGETGNTPSTLVSVDSWLEISVNGVTKYIPLYD